MAGTRSRPRGELESLLMDVLWNADAALTAKQIVDAVPAPVPALTTVLTVLERLRAKGLVERSASDQSLRFVPTRSRADHAASLMSMALAASTDREAALLQFAGELDGGEIETLIRSLQSRAKRTT